VLNSSTLSVLGLFYDLGFQLPKMLRLGLMVSNKVDSEKYSNCIKSSILRRLRGTSVNLKLPMNLDGSNVYPALV
jgi:hypothetical protein